jgi:hypothetical protein
MSQPVKLSDSLVLDARLAAEVMERSIAGQVEFWARIGRSVDQLLEGRQVTALSRNAAVRPLSELLATVDSPEGRRRVAAYLETLPFPHFHAHPGRPGLLEKIDEDGTCTVGRFVNRAFVAVRPSVKRARKLAKPSASVRSRRLRAAAGD